MPVEEEANDSDHEVSDQVTIKPRRSTRIHAAPEWYGNPFLEVMLYDNEVWTLEVLPEGRKAIQNKWIFKKKTDVDGNVTVYKARLVAKGFSQVKGFNYDETFSPVAMLKSVRIMLALAAFFDYEIW